LKVSALRSHSPLPDAQYRMICHRVRSHAGLHFGPESRFYVEKRVARRMAAVEAPSLSSYLYSLRSDAESADELVALIDELTTNETYFFRELSQLRALIEEIIPEVQLRRRAGSSQVPVKIWSAGCASGEEPYTVAMMALEAGLVPGRDIRIYASDIAPTVLAKARRGVYRPTSLRDTSDAMREKYFEEKDGGFRIRDDVKKSVDFIHLNLLDRERQALLGSVDVTLCRNVIIYFDAEAKAQVIDAFYERISSGGYLLLGHSESLISISDAFELCPLQNDLVYRKPIPGEMRDDPWQRIAMTTVEDMESDLKKGER